MLTIKIRSSDSLGSNNISDSILTRAHAVHSFITVEKHILHPLCFDLAYEAARTTTNSLVAVMLSIDILFTGFFS